MRNLISFLAVSILLVGAALVIPQTAFSFPSDKPQVVSVQYKQEDGKWLNGCTATPLNSQPTLYLTASHCIEKDIQLAGHPTILWAINKEDDLALLWSQALEHKVGMDLAVESPKVGDEIHTISIPLGWDVPQLFFGRVASLRMADSDGDTFMTFGLPDCQGGSGSAILNIKGEIVSVLQYGWGIPCASVMGGAVYEKLRAFLTPFLER